jgi:hypothetical protein
MRGRVRGKPTRETATGGASRVVLEYGWASPPENVQPVGPNPGYLRAVNNQVQYFGGAGYPYSVTAADSIVVGSRHDLGSGSSTGSAQTASDGSFYDGYSICSTACPGSTGETDALQYWTVNGYPLPHVDSVAYKCTSITIDGH